MAVLALCRLLGDTEHGADLRPRPVRLTGRPNSRGDLLLDVVALIDEISDRPQTSRVRLVKLVSRHPIGPHLRIGLTVNGAAALLADLPDGPCVFTGDERDGKIVTIRTLLDPERLGHIDDVAELR